jgi:hypothetical protein
VLQLIKRMVKLFVFSLVDNRLANNAGCIFKPIEIGVGESVQYELVSAPSLEVLNAKIDLLHNEYTCNNLMVCLYKTLMGLSCRISVREHREVGVFERRTR